MNKSNFLIYGSYGYTGNLIASLACKLGLKPVLGGRNKEMLVKQANELHLDYRIFDVNDLDATKQALAEFIAVIHCAGPFVLTYKNMVEACLATHTHYIDITGEVGVIDGLMALNEKALAANIMVLPGAGFDVVPSDCLALHLKSRLPDATRLILAISSFSERSGSKVTVSRGTAKTMAREIANPTLMRDQGQLKEISSDITPRIFTVNNKPLTYIPITWGDLASAWWSTKIPHIETYMAVPKSTITTLKIINAMKFIFKNKYIARFVNGRINKMPAGPTEEIRKQSNSFIYGEVVNAAGKSASATIKTPNGYELTAQSTLLIIKKIISGNAPKGFQTPASAYGKDLVLEIAGVERVDLSDVIA